MNPLIAALALTLPLQLGPTGTQQNELVTRVYDLRGASPLLHSSEHESSLLPYLYEYSEHSPIEEWPSTDTVAELLLQTFDEEFQGEGRRFDLLENGRLRITAPAGTHKEVANLLGFLEQGFRRSVELRLDWIDRPAAAPLSPALVPVSEADKLVAAAAQPRSANLSVQPGRFASFSAVRQIELLRDYDVEIAQATSITDPIFDSFGVGTRCDVKAAAAKGGVWLAAFLSDGALAGQKREQQLDLGALITTERGADRQTAPAKLEGLSVVYGNFATTVFIPEGQAAVLDLGLDLRTGSRRGALILRALNAPREPLSGIDLASIGMRVELLDSSWFVPPQLDFQGQIAAPRTGERLKDWWQDQGALMVSHIDGQTGELEQALNEQGGRTSLSIGPWILLRVGARQATPLTLTDPALVTNAAPESASVVLTLRRGGAVSAQFSVPLTSGSPQRFAVGGEAWAVVDANVEVAQSAACIDPSCSTRFDGVLGRISGSRALDGAWTLDLQIAAHVLASIGSIEAGSMLQVSVERGEFDDLLVTERTVLGAPSGPRKRTFGATGGLQLDVELR